MALSITVPGASFSKYVSKVLLPYFDLASGYYLFGTDAANSMRNRAYGASLDLTQIAAPTYSAGYATISSVNGFETSLLLDTPYTQIVVAQNTVAATSLAILSRGSANADNFVDMLRLSGGVSTVDEWSDGSAGQTLSGLSSANFSLIGARWGGTGTKNGVFAHDGTVLQLANSSTNKTKTTTPTHTLKFGTGYNSGAPVMKVAAAVLFPLVLTDAQVIEIYGYLKPFLATRSVTVV